MLQCSASDSSRLRLAFGPEMSGFGSWEWIGEETGQALRDGHDVSFFHDEIPECDRLIFVKFHPSAEQLEALPDETKILYCPIDLYGSAAEIDADAEFLLGCDQILLHAPRLEKYFSSYAPVAPIDHHLRFHTPLRSSYVADGPFLWVGVTSNLRPLVDWVNQRQLPDELCVLTNFPGASDEVRAAEYGFQSHNQVRIGRWSAKTQAEWMTVCRGALDVKGDDFRARHKPPAKALDFLASGIPFAMNSESSPVEEIGRRFCFELASPDDVDRWLSREYWQETVDLAPRLRKELSLNQVTSVWRSLLEQVSAPHWEPA